MDARSRRAEALRVWGSMCLLGGLLVTAGGLFLEVAPTADLVVAGGLMVIIGMGLRLEGAITEHR